MELSLIVARSHLGQQGVEMRARELPFERARDAFVVAFKVQKPLLDRLQVGSQRPNTLARCTSRAAR